MSDGDRGCQSPTGGQTADSYAKLWGIVIHPAFRLGVLDARADAPLDHEDIMARIRAETPAGALGRLGFDTDLLGLEPKGVEMAQYRYEEGRLWFMIERPAIRAWGHPDYPPAAVRDYLWKRCEPELRQRAERRRQETAGIDIVAALR